MPFAIAQQTSITYPANTTHSVALPTIAKGQRLLLIASIDGAGVTFTAGLTGWTLVFAGNRATAWSKIATGAETTLSLTSSASGEMAAVVYAIAGAHQVTAIEANYYDHAAGEGTTYPFTNLALSGWADEESLFISGIGYDRASEFTITGLPSTDHTELTANFDSSNVTTGAGLATQYRIATVNALDPSDWTGSNTRSSTEFVIAIRPAPVSVANTVSGAATKNQVLNMPQFVSVGDFLLAIVYGGAAVNGTPMTLGTGWTHVQVDGRRRYYTKIATSTEAALAGSTIPLTLSEVAEVSATIYAIPGGKALDAGTFYSASDNTTSWNAVTVSGGSQKVVIIGGIWVITDETSGVPIASFGSDSWQATVNQAETVAAKPAIASAYLVGNYASYEPSIWTITGAASGRSWRTMVFAVRYVAIQPTVTDAGDEQFMPGETGITITGTAFGTSQGVGTVLISPTDNVNDAGAVAQTVTAWGDTSITITAVLGAIAFGATAYLFVKENSGLSNASGLPVSFVTRGPSRRMLLGMG